MVEIALASVAVPEMKPYFKLAKSADVQLFVPRVALLATRVGVLPGLLN